MEDRKRILSVDFDGVIHSYVSGWQGPGIAFDPPVPGALSFLVRAQDFFRVCIFSSRSGSFKGRRAMKSWFKVELLYYYEGLASHAQDLMVDHPITGDRVDPSYAAAVMFEALEFPWFKPAAFLTIADRSLCFQGEFPAAETLLGFKAWMQRDSPAQRAPATEEILDADGKYKSKATKYAAKK